MMDAHTSKFDTTKDQDGHDIMVQSKYAAPRAEEVRLYGKKVAALFGRFEVKRTKKHGKQRKVGSIRNAQSLKLAKEAAGDTSFVMSSGVSESDEYDTDSDGD